MKKSGFTLAEVLISIAIVGVAAALTLPTLSLNVEKKKIGSALMKAINTIESASTFAIQVNDVRKLSEIKSINNNEEKVSNLLSDLLPKYTKLVPMPYSDGETAYGTKDGVVYYKGAKDPNENVNLFHIVVDTNGERGPDVIGRDKFDLYVKEDGIVLPKGSYAYKNEIGGSESWTTKCPDKEATNPAKFDQSYCAGHIADNSGRISYAYESIGN